MYIGRLYSTCRRVQRMLLTAYGRSVLVYKMYIPSFIPARRLSSERRAVEVRVRNINNRQRSDSRCYSLIIEKPVTKVCLLHTPTYCLSSHQEHRAICLRCLAELAHKPAGSRPLLSIAVIDFLPINQARLRFSPFQGILRPLQKVAMPFIRVVLFFFGDQTEN